MLTNIIIAAMSLLTFLGGLRVMRNGLEAMAAGRLPLLLQRLVRTPTRGIATGVVITALVQSSAAITAISVGMVAGGSMVFKDALGVVLGANVGSTITPQILTLNLWNIAIPCFVTGCVGLLSKRPKYRAASMACLGFGSIFIALQCLKLSLHPVSQTPWFRSVLAHSGHNVLIALATGCLVSALIQSSTATTVITMALTAQGVIPLIAAIAIVLGANVGTCLTSIIAAIGQPRSAQQVALAHVLLNLGGVLVMMPVLQPFTAWMAYLAKDPAQRLANAHTIFNILCTAAVWPITGHFARLVERLLPDNLHA